MKAIGLSRLLGWLGILPLFLLLAIPAVAQENSSSSQGQKYGKYNVQQTIEFGFRYAPIGGNIGNYDTFVNLHSGARLLDYTLHVTSPDHKGKYFDNISLYNFGYGGDPNSLTRLRIRKSRIYEFTGQFRRDVNYFDYNLLDNPLNAASASTLYPNFPVTSALHGMNLAHRMTDLDLTLMPQSRVSVRLGYSRNVSEGPSFSSFHEGTEAQLFQNWKTTMNSYRMGADFKVLPKTTFSYDQFLDYYKQDTSWVDQNFSNYQLSNAVPVDLGIDYPGGSTPCRTPYAGPQTVPPTLPPIGNATCNGYVDSTAIAGYPTAYQTPGYSRTERPRTSLPTERFSFESTYIPKLAMSGAVSYATADNSTTGLLELLTGNVTRTYQQAASTSGPADAKRVTVTADWAGTYTVTSKFSISDEFRYDNWRIPGAWNFLETQLFASALPASMLNPPGVFTVGNCNASNDYAGAGCPMHTSSSGADSAAGTDIRFLGQNLRTNTFQLSYDFTPRFGGRIGYRYAKRIIATLNQTNYSAETFYPGGSFNVANPSNRGQTQTFEGAAAAARGDCGVGYDSALPSGTVVQSVAQGDLPAGCTLEPNGSIIFAGLTSGSDPSRGIDANINENALLLGVWAQPTNPLRMSFDLELYGADNFFTRITPRQMERYRLHVTYNLKQWASLDGSINLLETRNNVADVNDLNHDRTYSIVATLVPHDRYSFDLGYNYMDIYSQALICYASTPAPVNSVACPAELASPVPYQAMSFYSTGTHFAYFDAMYKPFKRVTATVGYSGTFAGGSTLLLSSRMPTGPLAYTYQRPYASLALDLGKVEYKAAWGYYGYNVKGDQLPVGLAVPLLGPSGFNQDFNGNTAMFSLRYSY